MRALGAHCRSESKRRDIFFQKFQMRSVGTVHKQGHPEFACHSRYRFDIADNAEIIRRSDIYRLCLGRFFECAAHTFCGYAPGEQLARARIRQDPHGFDAEQGHCVDRAAVDNAPADDFSAVRCGGSEHRLDAERTAAGAHKCRRRAEQLLRLRLRESRCSLAVKEASGVRYLRYIKILYAAERGEFAFMRGHMHTDLLLFCVRRHGVKKRSRHFSPQSLASLSIIPPGTISIMP